MTTPATRSRPRAKKGPPRYEEISMVSPILRPILRPRFYDFSKCKERDYSGLDALIPPPRKMVRTGGTQCASSYGSACANVGGEELGAIGHADLVQGRNQGHNAEKDGHDGIDE